MATKLSSHPGLTIGAHVFTAIGLSFGINSIFRPRAAYEMLELPLPASEADRSVIDSLMVLYGAKELFLAFAIYAVGYTGNKRMLGLTIMAACAAAFVDGAVIKAQTGGGEWNHWGYASVFMVLGGLLTGILD